MAKCVVCTTLNAATEAAKHPNWTTNTTADLLEKRYDRTSKSQKNRYCGLHSTTGTGRATEANAIRILKERAAAMAAAG